MLSSTAKTGRNRFQNGSRALFTTPCSWRSKKAARLGAAKLETLRRRRREKICTGCATSRRAHAEAEARKTWSRLERCSKKRWEGSVEAIRDSYFRVRKELRNST